MPKSKDMKKSWTRVTRAFCCGSETSEYSDVIFKCEEGQKVYALKGILAMHSPFFRSIFFGKMQESEIARSGNILTMTVPWKYDAFFALISYCHTGMLEVDHSTVIDLLLLADYYGMLSLLNHIILLIINEDSQDRMNDNYNDDDVNENNSKFDMVQDFDIDDQDVDLDEESTKKNNHHNKNNLLHDNIVYLECPLVTRENVLGVLECACRSRSAALRDYCLTLLEPDMAPALLQDKGVVGTCSSTSSGSGGGGSSSSCNSSSGGGGGDGDASSVLGTLSMDAFCSILIRDELCMEEIDVFRSVLKWGQLQNITYNLNIEKEENIDTRRIQCLKQIIKRPLLLVRYSQIPPKLLMGEVQQSGFVESSLIIEALAYIADPASVETSTSNHQSPSQLKNGADSSMMMKTPSIRMKGKILSSQSSQRSQTASQLGWGEEEDYKMNHEYKFRPRNNTSLSTPSWVMGDKPTASAGPFGLIDYQRFFSTHQTTSNQGSSQRGQAQTNNNADDTLQQTNSQITRLSQVSNLQQAFPPTNIALHPPLAPTLTPHHIPRFTNPPINTTTGNGGGGEGVWAPSLTQTPWLQRLRLSPAMPPPSSTPPHSGPSSMPLATSGGGGGGSGGGGGGGGGGGSGQEGIVHSKNIKSSSSQHLDGNVPIPSEQLIAYLESSGVTVKHVENRAMVDSNPHIDQSSNPVGPIPTPQPPPPPPPPIIPSSSHTDMTLARLEKLEADFDQALSSTSSNTKKHQNPK
mmetsp:Transcript_1421/g.1795  ORF Transcript_1421/g.1795 Transcript_1421/m.1795 type:complete len:747 (-) Transcript_1421:104-2344(-)